MINLELRRAPTHEKRNFRNVDWKAFAEDLGERLKDITIPELVPSPAELIKGVETLTRVISQSIEEVVPVSRPTPFTKRWWNKDIAKLRQAMRSRVRLAYRHHNDRTHAAHKQHRQARNAYADAIAKAKKDTWTSFLENLNNQTIWTANKYALGPVTDGGCARIPDLTYKDDHGHTKLAATNEDKAKGFYDTFFTKEIDAETEHSSKQTYPTPTRCLHQCFGTRETIGVRDEHLITKQF